MQGSSFPPKKGRLHSTSYTLKVSLAGFGFEHLHRGFICMHPDVPQDVDLL
jgi:hypothetical protein